MDRTLPAFLSALITGILFWAGFKPTGAQGSLPSLVLLDRDGKPATRITDGDLVRLRVSLSEKAASPVRFAFDLVDSSLAVGDCRIEAGQKQCESAAFNALGWYWNQSGQPQPTLEIRAVPSEAGLEARERIAISPRPVVMVHGFSSTWEAWQTYLGAGGYLAAIGVPGYAVGDGQVPGVMNTGQLGDPAGRTNTIAQNAAALGEYIAGVKKVTGAQQVDLVAHSMGGLIARYYIDRIMQERDVAQLIMLGSPMAGTDCANLPAALKLYLPATLEIQPGYVLGVFNPQITHRKGVPFHALAGVPVTNPVGSPCTATPTDLAVSLESVTAIPLQHAEMPVLHTDENRSPEVFATFVKPLLQTPAGGFRMDPDPPNPAISPTPLQFTRVYTGHVAARSNQNLTIQLEPGLQVASFALYDPTRSLDVTVRGASGNVIQLDPVKNGLTELVDPTTLFYLGYGFQNPKPGVWHITLNASEKTPSGGADFAVRARYQGGAALIARASNLLPGVGEPIQLSASLDLAGQALPVEQGQAVVQSIDGKNETLDLAVKDGVGEASWTPGAAGLYSIAITAAGHLEDGSAFERVSYLTVEAQTSTTRWRAYVTVGGIALLVCLGGGLVAGSLVGLLGAARKRRKLGSDEAVTITERDSPQI